MQKLLPVYTYNLFSERYAIFSYILDTHFSHKIFYFLKTYLIIHISFSVVCFIVNVINIYIIYMDYFIPKVETFVWVKLFKKQWWSSIKMRKQSGWYRFLFLPLYLLDKFVSSFWYFSFSITEMGTFLVYSVWKLPVTPKSKN